jgi:trk system potassium uptake protein TrkH
MGIALIILATTFLFARHFVAAIDETTQTELGNSFQAIWGALFTVASFLTTTGFESADWYETTNWTRLPTPGLLLAGLALIGGGVATSAGGIKLLRVYALYRHSERELERLVHPSSVGGGGREARRIRRKGAYISWIFFMLFSLSIAAVMVLLSLTGVQFETAMVLAVSALSTTGPLAIVAAETPIAYSGIPDLAKVILAMAMVLGRLETLAIIALFNPEIWRN